MREGKEGGCVRTRFAVQARESRTKIRFRDTHKDKLTLQIQRPKGIKKSVYFISLGARLISNQTEILYGGGGADDDDADGVINRDPERVSDDE